MGVGNPVTPYHPLTQAHTQGQCDVWSCTVATVFYQIIPPRKIDECIPLTQFFELCVVIVFYVEKLIF